MGNNSNGDLKKIAEESKSLTAEQKLQIDQYIADTSRIQKAASESKGCFEAELKKEKENKINLQRELDSLKDKYEQERRMRAQAEVINGAQKQKEEHLTKINEEMKNQAKDLKNRLDDLSNKYNALTATSSVSSSDLRNAKEQIESLRDINQEQKARIEELETIKQKLLIEEASVAKEIEKMRDLQTIARVDTDAKLSEIGKLKSDKEELEKKFEEREQKLREQHQKENQQGNENLVIAMKQQSEDYRFYTNAMQEQSKQFVTSMQSKQEELMNVVKVTSDSNRQSLYIIKAMSEGKTTNTILDSGSIDYDVVKKE